MRGGGAEGKPAMETVTTRPVEIPPSGEERAQVFAELRSYRRTIARLEAKRRRANDEDKRFRLGADIESMVTELAKLERLALAIHEEELAT